MGGPMCFSITDSKRRLLRWIIPVGLSAIALTYFICSAFNWLAIVSSMSPPILRSEWQGILHLGWPCAILLAVSLFCGWISWSGRRGALEMVLALYLISATAFWYDVSHGRWLFQVGIAGQKYRDSGQRQSEYPTWWWYNDRYWWRFWE